MFCSNVVCRLWDLVDLGLDDSLDRLQSAGTTGVTVPVTSGAVAQLRSNPSASPRVFRTLGGCFYQPEQRRYDATRVKPVVSGWLKGRDWLAEVAAACEKRGLELRLRVSALETARIGSKYPGSLAKSVFGDSAPNTLCPANPDVGAWLVATVADLAERYAPTAIEIGGLRHHSGAIDDSPLEIGFDPGDAALALLGLCFCESSRQWATDHGADATAAARSVQTRLDHTLSTATPLSDSWRSVLDGDEVLRRYVECQVEALDTLVNNVIAASLCPVILLLPPRTNQQVLPSQQSICAAAGAIVEAPWPIDGDIRELVAHAAPGAATVELEYDAADIVAEGSQHLVSTVQQAAEQRLGGASFWHFGVFGEPVLTAIKQAIRFASRTSK